jgi:hypothetical protein
MSMDEMRTSGPHGDAIGWALYGPLPRLFPNTNRLTTYRAQAVAASDGSGPLLQALLVVVSSSPGMLHQMARGTWLHNSIRDLQGIRCSFRSRRC